MDLMVMLSCNTRIILAFGTGAFIGFVIGVFGMGLAWAAGREIPSCPTRTERVNNNVLFYR